MVYTISNSLRDREYDKFSATAGSQSSVNVSIVGGSIVIGSVSANIDSIYVQSGANVQVMGSHAIDACISVPPVYIGGKAESTVPTEVSDGDAADYWIDTFGRLIIKGTNLGQEALDVNEVAPALLQSINTVNLNAVGSSPGSNVGAWVNVSDYANKTIYYQFTSGTTGPMEVTLDASHDAGSTVYAIGSNNFDAADSNVYVSNDEHHEYIRTRTNINEGGTLTSTITGRGGV